MIQYIQVETNEKGEIVRLGFVDSMTGAYSAVKKKLAVESELADFCAVEDHIAKIKEKARLNGIGKGRNWAGEILSKYSGLDAVNDAVSDHVASIKHIAQCEGENRKRQELQDILAKHSGLDPSNAVGDHIAAIRLKAYNQGYDNGWHDKQADIQKRIKQFEDAIRETIENE